MMKKLPGSCQAATPTVDTLEETKMYRYHHVRYAKFLVRWDGYPEQWTGPHCSIPSYIQDVPVPYLLNTTGLLCKTCVADMKKQAIQRCKRWYEVSGRLSRRGKARDITQLADMGVKRNAGTFLAVDEECEAMSTWDHKKK
ncbi:MAG: hypothetical protein ACLRTA_04960 [Clostridia bacterium]